VPVPGIDYDRFFELPMEAANELTAAVNNHISETLIRQAFDELHLLKSATA
jgi:hypothetical protein